MLRDRILIGLLAGALAIPMLACGNPVAKVREAADRARVANNLKQFGLAYHQFNDANSRPPTSFDDLLAFLTRTGQNLPSDSVAYIVYWNANLTPEKDDPPSSDQVLAKAPPMNGQTPVLFLDGSVRMLDPAELFAAPTAKPKTKP
jgi:prepilin-type processing-associated H-X9-DG protein